MNEADDEARTEAEDGVGRAAAGVEHLQTAALEVISAARAFLDVAEDVVTNGEHLDDVSRIVGSVAQGVSNATGFTVAGMRPSAEPSPEPAYGPDVDSRPSGVQHIRVS